MRVHIFAYVNVCLVIVAIVARLSVVASMLCCGSATYESLDDLQKSWRPGHIIICVLPNVMGSFGFHHYMLAVDEENIVHTLADKKAVPRVTITNYRNLSTRTIKRDSCRNLGYGIHREGAVQRALAWDPEKPVYFRMLGCNCKDWVIYWADGVENPPCPSYK